MPRFLQNVHISMAGLMLALASLGNLVTPYGTIYRNGFGLASLVLCVMIFLKAILMPKSLLEWISAPLTASVLPTFFMGVMILATYLKPFAQAASSALWITAVMMHAGYILLFSLKYLRHFKLQNVFTSYFIVYVGIVAASVTAPAFGFILFGQILFWFGFGANIILIPIVLYRYLIVKGIPELVKPTVTIFAAPTSLCLAGYLQSFPVKNNLLIVFMTTLACFMLIFVFGQKPGLLKVPFSPSYAAFTFPCVISAIAIKGVVSYLGTTGGNSSSFIAVSRFLEFWAIAISVYVFIRFVLFLFPVPAWLKRREAKSSIQA